MLTFGLPTHPQSYSLDQEYLSRPRLPSDGEASASLPAGHFIQPFRCCICQTSADVTSTEVSRNEAWHIECSGHPLPFCGDSVRRLSTGAIM